MAFADGLRKALRKLRFELREQAGLHPWLLPAWRMLSRTRPLTVHPGTDLVIEGFPRSANSFALLAFTLAQDRKVSLAHHLHIPSQVIYAVRHRIPSVVLIRPPDEAVVAAKLVMPSLSLEQLARAYIRFYQRILPFRENVVVGTFQDVTTRFGFIIQQLNAKFNTRYGRFEHSRENQERCFAEIDRLQRATGIEENLEITVARPSTLKERAKDAISREMQGSALLSLMSRARELHEAWVAGRPP